MQQHVLRFLLLLVLLWQSGNSTFAQAAPAPGMTGKIMTVLGPIEPDDLGLTLTHEHVFIDFTLPLDNRSRWTSAFRDFPETTEALRVWNTPFTDMSQRSFMLEHLWQNRDTLLLQDISTSLAEVQAFKAAGGQAIVDATSIGIGRSPNKLREIATRSGLNIIMGAGWYQAAWHPDDLHLRSIDSLTKEIVSDITVGVGRSGVRAGIIGEVSVMDIATVPADTAETKVLRAAVRASRLTGAPITLHQWIRDGTMLELTMDIIEEEGGDLSRVVLGHIDAISAKEVEQLKGLLDKGVMLEFDLLGTPYILQSPALDDRGMADAIVTLTKAGYVNQLLMSQDVCTKLQQISYGGKGFTYIQKEVVTYMMSKGLSQKDVRIMQVDNPRTLLTFAEPKTLLSDTN